MKKWRVHRLVALYGAVKAAPRWRGNGLCRFRVWRRRLSGGLSAASEAWYFRRPSIGGRNAPARRRARPLRGEHTLKCRIIIWRRRSGVARAKTIAASGAFLANALRRQHGDARLRAGARPACASTLAQPGIGNEPCVRNRNNREATNRLLLRRIS